MTNALASVCARAAAAAGGEVAARLDGGATGRLVVIATEGAMPLPDGSEGAECMGAWGTVGHRRGREAPSCVGQVEAYAGP